MTQHKHLYKTQNDHPTEDHFGFEIQTGDKWFVDSQGRIFLAENMELFLMHFVGVEFFRSVDEDLPEEK